MLGGMWLAESRNIQSLSDWEGKGQMISNALIFIPFPFVNFFQIAPFLLRTSSCSSSLILFSQPSMTVCLLSCAGSYSAEWTLAISSSISRLFLKTSAVYREMAHIIPTATTSLNLYWKPLRAPLKEMEHQIEGSIWKGDVNVIQGGGKKAI